MLFLRALLFLILGTFVVALPISDVYNLEAHKLSPDDQERIAGYWESDVSDSLSHLV